MTTVAHPPTQGYRTIRFPLLEHEYERVLADRDYARSQLQEISKADPELFPEAFAGG